MAKTVGYDLGKSSGGVECTAPSKKQKNEKYYPSLCVTDKELPYVDDLEVGDRISLITLYEVTNIEEIKNKDREVCRYTLDIIKVAEDSGIKMSKALEKFMGEHDEIDVEKEKDED